MGKLHTFFNDPKAVLRSKYKDFHYRYLRFCLSDKVYPYLPDRMAIKAKFEWLFGRKLDLKNPKTFNEKLQWLKLHDRNPLYHTLVDKAEVKKWVAKKIGEEYIIPTYGVYNTIDEIDFGALPNQFVLKCTHDSASVIICKDKESFDIQKAKHKLSECLRHDQYLYGREWAYKGVKPRIIAEEYLEDETGGLNDYKFFTFDGIVKIIQIDFDRQTNHKRNLYSVNWEQLPYGLGYPTDNNHILQKPKQLKNILKIVRILSKNMTHARIDMYIVKEKPYFGEITFYHGSGFEHFTDSDKDTEWGSWINIKKGKKRGKEVDSGNCAAE